MFSEQLSRSLKSVADASVKSVLSTVGVDDNAILDIEANLRVELPGVFKEFLRCCGSDSNLFFIDNGFILYPLILTYKESIIEEAREDGEQLPFPRDSIVFKTYQDEEYWLFICTEDDDPEVYYLGWGDSELENTGFRLSEFLLKFFKNSILEKEMAEKYSSLDIVVGFSWKQNNDSEQLESAVNDINKNIDLYIQSKSEGFLIENLIRCLDRLPVDSDVSQSILTLLGKLDVTESSIALALQGDVSEPSLRYLQEFADSHKISDPYLQTLLKRE